MTYARCSEEAKASRAELPADVRGVLPDIMDLLCDEPDKGRSIGGGIHVYKHPDPPLQVTYKLDTEADTIDFLDFAARIVKVPRNVFISYSHRDKKWFQLVRGKLGILEDLGVTFWTDLEIEAGDLWDQLIEERLGTSRAALLLVSQPFLESEYVRGKELPVLFDRLDDTGAAFKLHWLMVGPCDLSDDELGQRISQVQALVPVTKPLADLKKAKRKKLLAKVQRKLAKAVAN